MNEKVDPYFYDWLEIMITRAKERRQNIEASQSIGNLSDGYKLGQLTTMDWVIGVLREKKSDLDHKMFIYRRK